jgi:hypothetical protein
MDVPAPRLRLDVPAVQPRVDVPASPPSLDVPAVQPHRSPPATQPDQVLEDAHETDGMPAVTEEPVQPAALTSSAPSAEAVPKPPVESDPAPLVVQAPANSSVPQAPDLMPLAYLCTDLACVQTMSDVPPLLEEMTTLLGAVGVIVWLWDPIATELRPALTHGYSEHVVAQLPRVERDTNNATATAFRAARACVVKGNEIDNGALAVPLLGPGRCVGVLAIELPDRREQQESVQAQAMVCAAQFATLVAAQPMEASDRRFA